MSTDGVRLFPFRGQTILVTGAASGIGLATAETLYSRGASIVAVDLHSSVNDLPRRVTGRTSKAAADALVVAAQADVSQPEVLTNVLDDVVGKAGRLDAVIHCAGVSRGGTALATSFVDWQHVVTVNLSGAFNVARSSLPRLIASQGSLVLVASQLGLVGAKNSVAYASSKGGVINLMRSLALDYGPQGVRVNCLCPGPTETPFLLDSFARAADPREARQKSLGRIPLGRFGTSQEIANAAVFLASQEATFIHGTALVVDGGYLAG